MPFAQPSPEGRNGRRNAVPSPESSLFAQGSPMRGPQRPSGRPLVDGHLRRPPQLTIANRAKRSPGPMVSACDSKPFCVCIYFPEAGRWTSALLAKLRSRASRAASPAFVFAGYSRRRRERRGRLCPEQHRGRERTSTTSALVTSASSTPAWTSVQPKLVEQRPDGRHVLVVADAV